MSTDEGRAWGCEMGTGNGPVQDGLIEHMDAVSNDDDAVVAGVGVGVSMSAIEVHFVACVV